MISKTWGDGTDRSAKATELWIDPSADKLTPLLAIINVIRDNNKFSDH